MATLSPVNVGSGENTGDGDPARTAFQKINSNEAALNADAASLEANKVPTTRQVTGENSIQGGGSLSTDLTFQLVNDEAAPGANRYYGTDASGVRGHHPLPTNGGGGGASALNDLTDVSIVSAQTGDVLRYDGTGWANAALGALAALSSVDTAQIENGAVTLGKLAGGTANRVIGFDGSGNPIELSAGTGIDITAGVISATGGGGEGAPTGASYLVLSTNVDLTNERVLVPSGGLAGSDGGANGNYTISIDDGGVTNANLADMAQATFKMRAAGAGTGSPIDGTATQARTVLNVEDGAQVNPALASQSEAEAGTNNTNVMTPLRTAQAISAQAGGGGNGGALAGYSPGDQIDIDEDVTYSRAAHDDFPRILFNDITIDRLVTLPAEEGLAGATAWIRLRNSPDRKVTVRIEDPNNLGNYFTFDIPNNSVGQFIKNKDSAGSNPQWWTHFARHTDFAQPNPAPATTQELEEGAETGLRSYSPANLAQAISAQVSEVPHNHSLEDISDAGDLAGENIDGTAFVATHNEQLLTANAKNLVVPWATDVDSVPQNTIVFMLEAE